MSDWLSRISLRGHHVTLLPLEFAHREALLEAASDGNLWELWYTSVPKHDTIDGYLATALEQQQNGESLPFVVVRNSDQKIVGCTRFCQASAEHKRVEIGYTWYARSCQRTSVNTETKLLMLTHAFESLNVLSVVFQTHWHNLASRRAIERLGAKQDGVLRNHRVINGVTRDTVIFSILQNEWPATKCSLQSKLQRAP